MITTTTMDQSNRNNFLQGRFAVDAFQVLKTSL